MLTVGHLIVKDKTGERDKFARMDSISQFVALILRRRGDSNRVFLGQ